MVTVAPERTLPSSYLKGPILGLNTLNEASTETVSGSDLSPSSSVTVSLKEYTPSSEGMNEGYMVSASESANPTCEVQVQLQDAIYPSSSYDPEPSSSTSSSTYTCCGVPATATGFIFTEGSITMMITLDAIDHSSSLSLTLRLMKYSPTSSGVKDGAEVSASLRTRLL